MLKRILLVGIVSAGVTSVAFIALWLGVFPREARYVFITAGGIAFIAETASLLGLGYALVRIIPLIKTPAQ